MNERRRRAAVADRRRQTKRDCEKGSEKSLSAKKFCVIYRVFETDGRTADESAAPLVYGRGGDLNASAAVSEAIALLVVGEGVVAEEFVIRAEFITLRSACAMDKDSRNCSSGRLRDHEPKAVSGLTLMTI